MKKLKICIALLLSAILCTSGLITVNSETKSEIDNKRTSIAEHLLSLETPIVFSVGGEWMVTGLARDNKISKSFVDGYYNNAVEYVENNGSAKLDRSKVTENARMIIALSSIGMDVTNVGGYNLLEPLADFSYIKKQGIVGAIWSLIALDSLVYDLPQYMSFTDVTSREKLLDYIISKQLSDGGWDRRDTASDPDVTSMAIMTLTPYYQKNRQIKNSVDKAVITLSKLQQDNGGFSSYGATNSNSCAQVITALSGIGIDANTDERFIKNGHSAIDALMSFSTVNGFSYRGGEYDQMSTEQGYYALAAYKRYIDNTTTLFDMTDLITPQNGLGDVDGNGELNVMDSTNIQKYITGLTSFSYRQSKIADFDRDGCVTVIDATEIQKYIVMK